jgi:hypothetical protein
MVVGQVDALKQRRADGTVRPQPSRRGDDLHRLLDDLAGELDLVQRAAGSQRKVGAAAGVDAAPAGVDADWTHAPGPAYGSGQRNPVKTPVPSARRNLKAIMCASSRGRR